jgi:hypothetical protein
VAALAAHESIHGQSCIYMLVIYIIFPMLRFICPAGLNLLSVWAFALCCRKLFCNAENSSVMLFPQVLDSVHDNFSMLCVYPQTAQFKHSRLSVG